MYAEALFQDYHSREDYLADNLLGIEPMTAKEITDEEEQYSALVDPRNIVEEKFDGTRATLHFTYNKKLGRKVIRVFSRRESVKTGWYCENTDNVPHIRDSVFPSFLIGTILDGEMFIPDHSFSDSSAIMNCSWEEAVARQQEVGKEVLHCFDIVRFCGLDCTHMTLEARKKLLHSVIEKLFGVYMPSDTKDGVDHVIQKQNPYIVEVPSYCSLNGDDCVALYHDIVKRGGEGVMVKYKRAIYESKRSKAYLKIKKFLTRECILLGFTEPTKEYKGKFPSYDKWDYWEDSKGNIYDLTNRFHEESMKAAIAEGEKFTPISKFYAKNWVGNMIFGVVVTEEELNNITSLPKNKGKKFISHKIVLNGKLVIVLEVGECAGFDEELRSVLSDHDIGRVIEVKANEMFKETGKLRHPRFLRFREDKNAIDCKWESHVNVEYH